MKAIVKTGICPMHTQPDAYCELADEVLYGMVVDVLEQCPRWRKIQTHYRYEGWVPAECLLEDESAAAHWSGLPKAVVLEKDTCDVMFEPKVQSWPLVSVPLGSLLAPVGEASEGWQKVELCDGSQGYARSSILGEYYTSPPTNEEHALRQLIVQNARRYANTQYRWGGKTPMGIDCSGLVSMAYLLSGIVIYRDAHIRDDFPIHAIPYEQMKPADLLFFPGHVAMFVGNGRYLHATGKAGSDGFAYNSLDPNAFDYRADLRESLTEVGSYFSYHPY